MTAITEYINRLEDENYRLKAEIKRLKAKLKKLRAASTGPATFWAHKKDNGMGKWRVRFALGYATVKVLSTIKMRHGIIHHVEDIVTGHCDFVGPEWMELVDGPVTGTSE